MCLGSFLFPALIRLGIYVCLNLNACIKIPKMKGADRLYPHFLHTQLFLYPCSTFLQLLIHWNNLLNSDFPLIPLGLGS